MDETPEQQEAMAYLNTLINKTLRIHTPDSRVFVGAFKCTDAERNIILAHTYEYRIPEPPKLTADTVSEIRARQAAAAADPKLLIDVTPRYMGLVVVPGEHILRIELEEFASQMKGKTPSPAT